MNSMNEIPKMKVGITYVSTLCDRFGNELSTRTQRNVFTTEGRNYLLDAAMGSRAKLTAFYLGLFEANYTPITSDTAAAFSAAATETTVYTPSTRPLFTPNAVAAASLTNVGLEAQFTFTADKRVYGAFTSSAQAKGATTGVLLSAAKFASYQDAKAGNVMYLQAGCELLNI